MPSQKSLWLDILLNFVSVQAFLFLKRRLIIVSRSWRTEYKVSSDECLWKRSKHQGFFIILVCNMKLSSNAITLYSDCPSSVTIKPSSEPFKAGDHLKCTSNGLPKPSYVWTDEDGKVVSKGQTTLLYGGPFNLTCTATGNFTTPCKASNSVSGNASGKHSFVYALFVVIHLSQVEI